jgi:hypothetical protein
MSALTMTLDLAQLRDRHERGEQLCEQAAEAERAAYLHWREAYGAYEVARDEASAALTAWVQALVP